MDFELKKAGKCLIRWEILTVLSLWWVSPATAGSPLEDLWFLSMYENGWSAGSEIRFEPTETNRGVLSLPRRHPARNRASVVPVFFGHDTREYRPIEPVERMLSDPLQEDSLRTGMAGFPAPAGNPATIVRDSNELPSIDSKDRIPLDPLPRRYASCGNRSFPNPGRTRLSQLLPLGNGLEAGDSPSESRPRSPILRPTNRSMIGIKTGCGARLPTGVPLGEKSPANGNTWFPASSRCPSRTGSSPISTDSRSWAAGTVATSRVPTWWGHCRSG